MRRRVHLDPARPAAVDSWVARVAPATTGWPPPVRAPRRSPLQAAELTARLDAVVWAAAGLTDERGLSARALALRADDTGIEVLMSRPVVAPAAWRRLAGDRLVVPPGAAAALPGAAVAHPGALARAPADIPLLVAFDAADDAVVLVDVAAVGALGVPDAGWLGRAAAALLRTPLAPGLDVILCGVDPAGLPALPVGAPGRPYVVPDLARAHALARGLRDPDDPVVVVYGGPDPDPAATLGDGVPFVAGPVGSARWRLAPSGDRTLLEPLRWPVGRLRPA